MTKQTVQKGWVYEEDGLIIYRASSLYSCLRSMVACRTGETAMGPAQWLRDAMDASAGLEEELLARAADQLTGDILWQQKRFDLVLFDNVIVRMHIDAMHQNTDTIIEAKALGDALWEKYIDGGLNAMGTLGEKYRWQGAVQGYATGRKVRFAVGHKVKRDDGTWRLDEVRVSEPYAPESLVSFDTIVGRIALIEEHAAMDELPECDFGCREGDPFSEVHIFASVQTGDEDLLERLARIEELTELIGSDDKDSRKRCGLLGELADLKDDVKEEYGNDRQTEKVTVGPYTASIVPNKGRMSIDQKWLKRNYPEVYDASLKMGQPYRTLILKRAKGSGGDQQEDAE